MLKGNKNLIILHATVIVWGFTSVLVKLITIDAVSIVWYRLIIAVATLILWFALTKKSLKITKKQFISFVLTGGIVALHWIFFSYSIHVSTISVTLVCMSSFTLFTSIIEPLIKKTKIVIPDILVGILICIGIFMIFKFESKYTLGIIFGLLAAVAASLFSTINSTFVQKCDPSIISFYELAGGLFWITLYKFWDVNLLNKSFMLSTSDWIYLTILGSICTSVAYVAGVSVMRTMSAFRVSLVSNLEPVYGIILALIFFKDSEQMTTGFYFGSIIILAAVILYPIYKNRNNSL
ncbi:DMT family transporter [Pedobacter changchengzhani]|uniref:DMT family transporter n=1 Tax=Pedobacter changchengzhani TaxID=2529274 RepID=A0A4V3A0B1_9SPHI|nr:DMT family transporter [Pedobacter changchengzhani]TDG36323.1 DMT family transporter [Pedobacter changchengzhani]